VLQYIFIDKLKKRLEIRCELKLLGTYYILNGPSKAQINLGNDFLLLLQNASPIT